MLQLTLLSKNMGRPNNYVHAPALPKRSFEKMSKLSIRLNRHATLDSNSKWNPTSSLLSVSIYLTHANVLRPMPFFPLKHIGYIYTTQNYYIDERHFLPDHSSTCTISTQGSPPSLENANVKKKKKRTSVCSQSH